ncbi:MAG TPA: hypothetical protein VLH84_00355 [Patescibacteria group bacterium]|nr:hypothetical protein [Patescibacteria group bacterium]
MSKEYKKAIALTRTNGIGNEINKHAFQTIRIAEFAQQKNLTVKQYFAYNTADACGEGITDMMQAILTYLRHHPDVKHLIVTNPDRICRSYSLYEMFDNHLAGLGVSIEAPGFHDEEENL